MRNNKSFVPDYLIKYQAKQPKAAKELIMVKEQATKTKLEKRNEDILNQPELVNEHYIKGEQRKALEFFKKENIKFHIYQNKSSNGYGKYFIRVFGRDRETNRSFTISIGKQGTYRIKKKRSNRI